MAFLVIFQKIKTDRLHVGIACSILDVNCDLSSGAYWKNKEVFAHSIRPQRKKGFAFIESS